MSFYNDGEELDRLG